VCVVASSRPVVTRGVDKRSEYITDDEDEQQVGRSHQISLMCQISHSPTRTTSYTSDNSNNANEDYSHPPVAQHNAMVRPSYRKKIEIQREDAIAAKPQSTYEPQLSTEIVDTHSTYVNTAQPLNNKPSANRRNRSNPPDQSDVSMDTTISLSQQSSGDSQINVKVNDTNTTHDHQRQSSDTLHTAATNGNTPSSQQTSGDTSKNEAGDNVAMTTNCTWDSNIPSYWAPMDGSSVKTVVLHPTDIEYQLVADTFLTSLGNTLATVVQVHQQ
jgi:hypothetical protein